MRRTHAFAGALMLAASCAAPNPRTAVEAFPEPSVGSAVEPSVERLREPRRSGGERAPSAEAGAPPSAARGPSEAAAVAYGPVDALPALRAPSYDPTLAAHALPYPLAAQEEPEPEEELRSELTLFVGAGRETGNRDDSGLALGLGYLYELNERWALSGAFETLGPNTDREWLVFLGAKAQATERLFFQFGPGWEYARVEKGDLMFRVGAGYRLNIAKEPFSISPVVYYDFVESGARVLLFGFETGLGF